jgi:hypothetical protein
MTTNTKAADGLNEQREREKFHAWLVNERKHPIGSDPDIEYGWWVVWLAARRAGQAVLIEQAAKITEYHCVCDNGEDDEEMNRVLRNKAAQIRGLIAAALSAPERCSDPAACDAQGCRNPRGRCEEAAPVVGEVEFEALAHLRAICKAYLDDQDSPDMDISPILSAIEFLDRTDK